MLLWPALLLWLAVLLVLLEPLVLSLLLAPLLLLLSLRARRDPLACAPVALRSRIIIRLLWNMPLLPRMLRELPCRAPLPFVSHGAHPDQPHPRQHEAHSPVFGSPSPRRAGLQVLCGHTVTTYVPINHHAGADPALGALEASFIVATLVVVEGLNTNTNAKATRHRGQTRERRELGNCN